jgi:hypothetical protein
VFGSRTTASTAAATASTAAATASTTAREQADAASSLKPVLKRPPLSPEPTTRSRPHTTEPFKDDTATPVPETTAKATSAATTTTTTTTLKTAAPTSASETTGHLSRARVRIRDPQIGRFQNGSSPRNASSTRSFARNLDEANEPEESNDRNVQLSRIVEGVVGVDNETGNEKIPDSAPLIAPTPENLNSDKRSSLVRSRTTASKFLTSTRRTPDVTPSTTTSTTTTTTTAGSKNDEEEEEELYSDKRLAELSHSGPDYQSTEREESTETETVKDATEPQVPADDTESNGQSEQSVPVVERPAGLQKELLAAIRRKITQTRGNATSPPPSLTTEPADRSSANTSFENNDVSPDANAISSTQHPSFFKPIPFPADQNRSGTGKESGDSPRVQFFVRVPNSKPGSQVKIPDISHIQGKLARLNAAITEGLQEQRKQQTLTEAEAPVTGQDASLISSTTAASAISPTPEPVDEESLLVLTSTSVSSIFSVVTGSSQIKSATTTAASTTSTSTTKSTTATTSTTLSTTTTATRPPAESSAPRLAFKDRIYETGSERNVESTSKASSVSEIITIGKTELARTAEASTDRPLEAGIAQKTYTYLDRLRENRQQPPAAPTTSSSTTTTTTTATTTSASPRTTTNRSKPVTTKKQQVRWICSSILCTFSTLHL